MLSGDKEPCAARWATFDRKEIPGPWAGVSFNYRLFYVKAEHVQTDWIPRSVCGIDGSRNRGERLSWPSRRVDRVKGQTVARPAQSFTSEKLDTDSPAPLRQTTRTYIISFRGVIFIFRMELSNFVVAFSCCLTNLLFPRKVRRNLTQSILQISRTFLEWITYTFIDCLLSNIIRHEMKKINKRSVYWSRWPI